MESLRRWIVFQGLRKGVRQFSRRIYVSAKDVRSCQSSLDAPLPCHKHSGKTFIFLKPGSVDHTAYIQYYCYMREGLFHFLHHLLFCFGQTKITVLKNAGRKSCKRLISSCKSFICNTLSVPAFSRIPADCHYSRICKSSGLSQQLFRNFRLQSHSRTVALCILSLNFLFIIPCSRPENLHFSFLLLNPQTFHKISGISHGHVSASSAALYIVHCSLSKNCQFLSFTEGKQRSFIFQQHHSLSCCLSRQFNMLPASCHSCTLFSKGQTWLIIKP